MILSEGDELEIKGALVLRLEYVTFETSKKDNKIEDIRKEVEELLKKVKKQIELD